VAIIETEGAGEAKGASEGAAGEGGAGEGCAGDEVIILLVSLPSSFFKLTRCIFNR
jgi:hypothetical protein